MAMSLILGIVLTGAAAIAGTVLCSPPAGSCSDRDRLPGLALTIALAAGLLIAGRPATAGELLMGHATVIDGPTLDVDGVPVTLFGIVTPAADATCWDAHEVAYACGRRVRAELAARLGAEAPNCERHGRPADRPLKAVCRVGGEDLGEWMIAHGYAVPDGDAPDSYRKAGDRAWGRRVGLWGGVFTDPASWRQGPQ